jgi:hypothetical protein
MLMAMGIAYEDNANLASSLSTHLKSSPNPFGNFSHYFSLNLLGTIHLNFIVGPTTDTDELLFRGIQSNISLAPAYRANHRF